MTPDDFITRMTVLYGPPDTIDNEMFLDEYRAVLRGTAPPVIRLAGDIIRDTQVRRFWPTPAEVKEAIRKAAATGVGSVRRPAEHAKFEPEPELSEEALAAHEASKARVDILAKAIIRQIRAGVAPEPELRDEVAPNRDEFQAMQIASPNRFHRGH